MVRILTCDVKDSGSIPFFYPTNLKFLTNKKKVKFSI